MTDANPIHPLTIGRWDDLVDLFGPERGANSGCWCMWWRMTARDFEAASREDRRDAFKAVVADGPPPGLLAYHDGQAVGWCAVGPRPTLPRIGRSRVAKPVEGGDGVWFVSCFYIRSGHRKSGLMAALLEAAVDYAVEQGANMIEACPIDPARTLQWGEGFVGIASVFRAAGFEEIARRSPNRPLMRLVTS